MCPCDVMSPFEKWRKPRIRPNEAGPPSIDIGSPAPVAEPPSSDLPGVPEATDATDATDAIPEVHVFPPEEEPAPKLDEEQLSPQPMPLPLPTLAEEQVLVEEPVGPPEEEKKVDELEEVACCNNRANTGMLARLCNRSSEGAVGGRKHQCQCRGLDGETRCHGRGAHGRSLDTGASAHSHASVDSRSVGPPEASMLIKRLRRKSEDFSPRTSPLRAGAALDLGFPVISSAEDLDLGLVSREVTQSFDENLADRCLILADYFRESVAVALFHLQTHCWPVGMVFDESNSLMAGRWSVTRKKTPRRKWSRTISLTKRRQRRPQRWWQRRRRQCLWKRRRRKRKRCWRSRRKTL